jgi:hypothetical protein
MDHSDFDLSEFDDWFLASFVLGSLDYDAQLRAIHGLLQRNREADEDLTNTIQKIDAFVRQASGSGSWLAQDEWVDHMHHSVYRDAAHSMAAVGMLAPFVEALFKQAFLGIRKRFDGVGRSQSGHLRWAMPARRQWDCSYVSTSKQKKLVDGIMELANAIDLTADLPADLKNTLSALFAYRNKMFHEGFEWPVSERTRFERRIATAGWPVDWFSKAATGGEPWIFYLSDTFVDYCLTTTENVLSGLGAFVRRNH